MNSINKRLSLLRKKLRLSQVAFGEWIGISQSKISELEQEGTEVKEYILLAIERLFHVDPQWLRDGKGHMGQVRMPDEADLISIPTAAGQSAESSKKPLTAKEPEAEYTPQQATSELSQLIQMTIEILGSNSHFSKSLRMNILSFYDGLKCQRELEELKNTVNDLGRRLSAMEQKETGQVKDGAVASL